MKRTLIVSALIMLIATPVVKAQTMDFSPRQERLKQHIYFLASDSLRGREGGSADALKAANYIVEQYTNIGLSPLYDTWMVPFTASSDIKALGNTMDQAYGILYSNRKFRNIVAVIEGSDPVMKHEFIIIGAHYDHLGVKGDKVYNGADDNASGTAAVIEIARILVERKAELKRSVIVCAFDGEELGLLGSTALARKLTDAKDADNLTCEILGYKGDTTLDVQATKRFKMMMSIDMVGWLKEGKALTLEGTGTLDGCKKTALALGEQWNVPIRCKKFETSMLTATDTEPFAKRGIPTLAITTGLKSPYHKPEDDAELIDYEGLDRIVQYLSELTIAMASSSDMNPSGQLAAKHEARMPFFELGLTAGYNRNALHYTEAAFNTRRLYGYEGGLNARLNMGYIALQVEGLYSHARSLYPDSANIYGSSLKCSQDAITMPVSLILQIPKSRMNCFVGCGVYYSWLMGAKTDKKDYTLPLCEEHPWGIQWSWGMRLNHWNLAASYYFQMNNLFSEEANALPVPLVRNRKANVTLTYYFW
jgi:hypothetical protein